MFALPKVCNRSFSPKNGSPAFRTIFLPFKLKTDVFFFRNSSLTNFSITCSAIFTSDRLYVSRKFENRSLFGFPNLEFQMLFTVIGD